MTEFWTAPRACDGKTITCIASGPSLTLADIRRVFIARAQGATYVIAVNDSVFPAWFADYVYASDGKWFKKYGGLNGFKGIKVTIENALTEVRNWPEIKIMRNTGTDGLELKPDGLRTGRSSGYSAINLSVHLGAQRIVLLGYDMKPGPDGQIHWFGDHEDWPTNRGVFSRSMLPHFATLVKPLDDLGVKLINATRNSAIEVFERKNLEEIF